MDATTIYQRFVERAPAAVLVHGLIESCLSPAFLDAVATPHLPASPNPRQLAFSHLVEILLPVVFESKKSVGQSYRDATHLHAVATLKCVYERLAVTPSAAVAALVEAVAKGIGPLLNPHPPGTRFLTLDGNHLAATQNRLADLAGLPAALPGQAMVLRDQATGVFLRVLLHEDGHANERSLHQQLRDWCEPALPRWLDLVITTDRAEGCDNRKARRHAAEPGFRAFRGTNAVRGYVPESSTSKVARSRYNN